MFDNLPQELKYEISYYLTEFHKKLLLDDISLKPELCNTNIYYNYVCNKYKIKYKPIHSEEKIIWSKFDPKDIENKWDILLNKLVKLNFLDKSVLNLNTLEEKKKLYENLLKYFMENNNIEEGLFASSLYKDIFGIS